MRCEFTGGALMNNHSHWIFEASTEESISKVMREGKTAIRST